MLEKKEKVLSIYHKYKKEISLEIPSTWEVINLTIANKVKLYF